jgi:S-(hydroxymethyl)glutathione dehydrogenase/alcohol dehydrogenase
MSETMASGTQFAAAVWRGGSTNSTESLRLSGLRAGEVLVRVSATNVSTSDGIWIAPENIGNPMVGPLPQVMGHAMVGIVEGLGAGVSRLSIGDRVIATSTPQCGRCWFCLRGRSTQCAEMRFIGPTHATTASGEPVFPHSSVGGFAELAVVPEIQLTNVATSIPDEQLALLACGFGSGLGAGLRISPVEAGSVAAAVGLGCSGLGFVQAARIAGARTIIGVDPVARRRELAVSLGATHVVDPRACDAVAAVIELGGDYGGLQGAGADFVFESAAIPEVTSQAWKMTRATASLVVSSVPNDMGTLVSFPAVPFACMAKRVYSSQFGGLNILSDLPWAVRLIEDGQLDLGRLCEETYDLDGVDQAIADTVALRVLGATVVPQ